MLRKTKYYLEGKSLYLVIFISFILSVFLLLFISNNYYTQIEVLYYQNLKSLSDINNSILLKQIIEDKEILKDEFSYDTTSLITNFNFKAFHKRWGGYMISGCRSEWKNLQVEKTAISGNYLFDKERTGLYLADQGKYLSIAGNTILTGSCYMPALGIRSVYIDGEAYRGGELIHGIEKNSKQNLPVLNEELIQWISKAYNGDYGLQDTLINGELLYNDFLTREFSKSAYVFESKNIIKLQDMHLSGKIIIRSDTSIILRRSCTCENIIAIAPKIVVESGFSGSIQLFASDSLLIEEQAKLTYPSFVSVFNINSKKTFCYISEAVTVQGGILCSAESGGENDNGELYLSDGAEIHGIVYCSGSTRTTGRIFGSLYTNRFVLKTSRGYYENHLLNATVDPEKQYKDFLVPAFFDIHKKGIIQWVQ